MRKDTLYITLSRDITSYTITSGQRAIATNVNYSVTIESPTLTTNLAGRDVSVIISDTEGNTLTTATTFYPDTKNPYKAVTGSLLLDGPVYAKFFDGKPVDTAVRLPIVIRDKSATLLSSDIVVMNGGENAEPTASDETVAGLVNAIRFYDLAEFKAWLDGTLTRDDGLLPTDIVVGQWVHTQNDGSFICKELIGAAPSVAKNFTAIVTQFPLTGTLKMNPANGVGLSLYSGDVYNEAEATSFSTDAITCKGEAFTFNAGDNQIARQKDNYALENRVNSKMDATLAAIKADNDETYNDMLPVMNTTVEARDRAETAASNAKASETRAVSAETNAATSEQNAEAYKKSAAVSEANAGLYRQQALAYAQKAETEAKTATDKATEAYDSASDASTSANEALAYKNDAGDSANAARLSAEASASSAESSAISAAASKSSSETAAQSEAIAVGSAAAAASSESTASQYKDTAVSASSLAVTSKDSASTFADAAAASASASAASASSSANSADAAAKSAIDLAEAVATAESLDGRITTIEGKGVDYKEDKRFNLSDTSSYFLVRGSYGPYTRFLHPNGMASYGALSGNDSIYYYYIQFSSNKRILVYDRSLKHVATLKTSVQTDVYTAGYIFLPPHNVCMAKSSETANREASVFCVAKTTSADDKADRNRVLIGLDMCDRTTGDVVSSWAPFKSTGFVDGDYWMRIGFLSHNALTDHYVLFGLLYRREVTTSESEDGTIVETASDTSLGTGFLCFTSGFEFVKHDGESFVTGETFDESFWHVVPCSAWYKSSVFRPQNGRYLNSTLPNVNHVTVMVLPQSSNSQNGLYYFDKTDAAVPILATFGEYYTNNNGVIPFGGSRLSCDSSSLNGSYYPAIIYQDTGADSENGYTFFVVCNGVRFLRFIFKDDTPTHAGSNALSMISDGQFGGANISGKCLVFTNNKAGYTGWTGLAIINGDGRIIMRNGSYVYSLSPLGGMNLASIAFGLGCARQTQYALYNFNSYQAESGCILLNL